MPTESTDSFELFARWGDFISRNLEGAAAAVTSQTTETPDAKSARLASQAHRLLDEEIAKRRRAKYFGDVTFTLKFTDGGVATLEHSSREVLK